MISTFFLGMALVGLVLYFVLFTRSDLSDQNITHVAYFDGLIFLAAIATRYFGW